MLQIEKRSGALVSFDPKKILNRIKKAAKGLKVNDTEIFVKVITSIPTEGKISTKELDKLISELSSSYTTTHYDYSKLSAGVAISSYHKSTDPSFYNTMKKLCDDGIVNKKLIETIEGYGIEKVQSVIDDSKDYNFNYFAWRTLEKMYLLKNSAGVAVERPQHMYMRVALWITDSFDECVEYYELLSKQLVSPATPIMINSGGKIPQLASCVLQFNESDSREGLLSTFRDISVYSADAAGIGLCMSNIRSKESKINSSGGKAGGLLKYLKIVNEGLRFFNQQGRRPGSCAVYIEPWHKDIFDLLDIKKNTGAEELRARDIFTALWIPDNFMRALETEGDWYLFCPNDIKLAGLKPFYKIWGKEYEEEYDKAVKLGIGKKVKAMDVFKHIYESQVETGVPYICFKDSINAKTNHQNIGVLSQSNLCCVDGDTIITVQTPDGDTIKDISMQDFVDEFELGYKILSENNKFQSVFMAAKTKDDEEVYEIEDEETGKKIVCTGDHLIFTKNRGYVRADELSENDVLEINVESLINA